MAISKHHLVITALLLSVVVLTALLLVRSSTNKEGLVSILQKQYSGRFETKTQTINGFLITSANSTTSPFDPLNDELDEKASPLVIVQDAKSQKVISSYEVYFDTPNELNKGNLISPTKTKFIDFDNDEEKELVAEWQIFWGGADGLKGLVVFDMVEDKFLPVAGLPGPLDETRSIVLEDLITGEIFRFPIFAGTAYSELEDINNNGMSEWLFGMYEWNLPEKSRGSPHTWNTQVLQLNKTSLEIPKWWNDGKSYRTTEKIVLGEKGEEQLYEIFISKTLTETQDSLN